MVPDDIHCMFEAGAVLAGSVSGGKDSQGQVLHLKNEGVFFDYLIHADLGRAEWPQSLPMCEVLAAQADAPLIVVERPQGDLVTQIGKRMVQLQGTGKPFWPSASNRYCTSDQKRDQINKRFRKHKVIISVEGIRAEESPARRKKKPLSIRSRITAKRLRGMTIRQALLERKPNERLAVTWYPVFDFSEGQIYEICGHTISDRNRRRNLYKKGDIEGAFDGWLMHPAYIFGNERVSCQICVLATKNDIQVGATHGPDLLEMYRYFERVGDCMFKNNFSLLTDLED